MARAGSIYVLVNTENKVLADSRLGEIRLAMRYLRNFVFLVSMDKTRMIAQIKPRANKLVIPWLKQAPSGLILRMGNAIETRAFVEANSTFWYGEKPFPWQRNIQISPR